MEKNGFVDNDGDIYFPYSVSKISAALGGGLKFTEVPSSLASSTTELNSLLSAGHKVVVGVELTTNPQGNTVPGHYVVVTGTQGSTYSIYDPTWYHPQTTLDGYPGGFKIGGYVSDPSDLSAIYISAAGPGDGVNILLTDPQGNKTGIDPSGSNFEAVPNSFHFIDGIVPAGSTGPAPEVLQYVDVDGPELGNYGIEISAIDAVPTSYDLMETAFAPDGTELWQREISGTVAPGSPDQYSFTYAVPEPGTLALLVTASLGLVGLALHRRRVHR